MSSVRSWPYVPRTPSVPKRRPTSGSALRVLRRLTRFLQSVLAPLLHARVAGQEAFFLEVPAERRVGLDQRARDAVPHGTRLAADPAAVDRGDHVVAVDRVRQPQRLGHDHLKRRPREVVLQRSEEHTSELQSQSNLVCRLLLEKKKKKTQNRRATTDAVSA